MNVNELPFRYSQNNLINEFAVLIDLLFQFGLNSKTRFQKTIDLRSIDGDNLSLQLVQAQMVESKIQ